ncbi:hypothetical protein SAMN05444169_3085 [Bradyrhizobium erythrophlei]|uniref:Uncharacterized protein n=1 Tax=Bradyrhizobium erythrophlei TaxID=1437360 RepID=A0A1M5KVV7_9BRAD|nr:hypothetical protein SAMN05444169_3085 [Bradyrhizobium erythrophlei]
MTFRGTAGRKKCQLLRLARKRNPAAGPRQNNPPGKSPKTLSTPSRKNIPLNVSGKSVIYLRASHPMRGAARDRHERAVGCGGREACERRAQAARTAKPCGPGAPTLGQVREKQNFSRATVARKPGHRGERGVSRNPSRRESRIASAEPVCSCAFSVFLCTRDRGCSAHPAFPAPSRCFARAATLAKPGRIAPRQCEGMSSRFLEVESEAK